MGRSGKKGRRRSGKYTRDRAIGIWERSEKELQLVRTVLVWIIKIGCQFKSVPMAHPTRYNYITRRDGVLSVEPIIEGTRTPVRAIVETWRLGTSPEEIPQDFPHLTLAQVFAALTYYSDHQEEINAYIERNRIPSDQVGTVCSGEELAQRLHDGSASSEDGKS